MYYYNFLYIKNLNMPLSEKEYNKVLAFLKKHLPGVYEYYVCGNQQISCGLCDKIVEDFVERNVSGNGLLLWCNDCYDLIDTSMSYSELLLFIRNRINFFCLREEFKREALAFDKEIIVVDIARLFGEDCCSEAQPISTPDLCSAGGGRQTAIIHPCCNNGKLCECGKQCLHVRNKKACTFNNTYCTDCYTKAHRELREKEVK